MPQDARCGGAREASNRKGRAPTASLPSNCVASCWLCVSGASLAFVSFDLLGSKLLRHEVRLANPLNLSI